VLAPLLVVIVLFTLDVHHTPRHQKEHEGVQQKTKHGRAPIRARDGLTQQTTGEHVRLRVGDDEKGQRRNNANGKLLFLLLTVATAATILEESHADVLYYGLRIFFIMHQFSVPCPDPW